MMQKNHMFLDSRDKSVNMLNFCRNDQRKIKNKSSTKGASSYKAQNTQFDRVMFARQKI